MATLNLVKTDKGHYFLQGTGDPSRNADFSLYDWDGEGGDPFSMASGQTWEIVELPGIEDGIEYDVEDQDSFWEAQTQIIEAAELAGIEVPGYAKGE